ncbi:thioesterase family protein [Azospirillum sp. A29]|jgi:acyl-CoA thioester hydrolase|uniref:acyl-CoA thioesterase n=1 Tax=Azospirillum sp. A29 TaxID=3160606 RepID=UPI00366F32EB
MTGTPDLNKPDLTSPDLYRFWWEERVRFNDLDAVGHVNNNALGVYFEQARVAMIHQVGGFTDEVPWTVVLARSLIEYKAELLYPNTVRIGARTLRLGTSSITLGCAIFLGDRCIATQEAVAVIVDKAAHRPTPIPEPLRVKLLEA